jgi:hypothetical protein
MADWTSIPDATFDPDRPVLGSTHLAIVKNFEALAEGAANAPRIVADTFSGAVAGDAVLFSALGPNVVFKKEGSGFEDVPGARFRAITSGTIRVSFEYARGISDERDVEVRVTKNGTSVLTQVKNTTTYTTHTIDVAYIAGDVLNVIAQGNTGGGDSPPESDVLVRNFQYLTGTTRLLGGT